MIRQSIYFLLFLTLLTSSANGENQDLPFEEFIKNSASDLLMDEEPSGFDKIPLPEVDKQLMESEILKCPLDYKILNRPPDPDLYTFIGFRYVRTDASTCDLHPTDSIYHQEEKNQKLLFNAQDNTTSFTYNLTTPEYVTHRKFYFCQLQDGRRRFYAYDSLSYTGKQIPETVELRFLNRDEYPLLPWETSQEKFLLEYGKPSGASISPLDTPYEYDFNITIERDSEGNLLTHISMKALKKKHLNPPQTNAVSLTMTDRKDNIPLITISDSHSIYYKKEKIGLKIQIKRRRLFSNPIVAYDILVDLDTLPKIEIDLLDTIWDTYKKENINVNRYFYFIEWAFRRTDSRLSLSEWIEKGKIDFPSTQPE